MALNFLVTNSDEIIYLGILIQKFYICENLYGFLLMLMVGGTLLSLSLYLGRKNEIIESSVYVFCPY